MRLALIIIVIPALMGCSGYMQFIDGLNDRQVNTCFKYEGSMRAGGLTVGGSGFVSGVTATGGASVLECMDRFGFTTEDRVFVPSGGVILRPGVRVDVPESP